MRMSKIVPALSLAVALAAGLISCKKEQAEAMFTVSVGEVQVVAADGTAAAAVPGMALTEKVTLVTGRDSMAMIQLGAEAVIKIQPESKLVLAEIMNPAKKLVLEEGVVLARLRKLEKDSAFSIQTETQIASVRGTTFRVASDGAVSTVSVGEGMVEVKPASGEAVVLNAGERALCEADKAVTKEKNTDVEKTELEEWPPCRKFLLSRSISLRHGRLFTES